MYITMRTWQIVAILCSEIQWCYCHLGAAIDVGIFMSCKMSFRCKPGLGIQTWFVVLRFWAPRITELMVLYWSPNVLFVFAYFVPCLPLLQNLDTCYVGFFFPECYRMDVGSCVPPTYVFCLVPIWCWANERAECADRAVPEHHFNLSLTFLDGSLFQLPPSQKECNLLK